MFQCQLLIMKRPRLSINKEKSDGLRSEGFFLFGNINTGDCFLIAEFFFCISLALPEIIPL